LVLAATGWWIWWHFDEDIQRARARSSQGSTLIDTRCGPIEVQQAGPACRAIRPDPGAPGRRLG